PVRRGQRMRSAKVVEIDARMLRRRQPRSAYGGQEGCRQNGRNVSWAPRLVPDHTDPPLLPAESDVAACCPQPYGRVIVTVRVHTVLSVRSVVAVRRNVPAGKERPSMRAPK